MPHFRADCSRCCGLCCVMPDHLAVQGFRVDKPAKTPCAHLNALHRCSIHATRRLHAYSACEGFDCFGAGQWITQHLFQGAQWSDSPGLSQQMFAAYSYWAPRFEAAALLEAALPHVRDDARCTIAAMMRTLTAGETKDLPTDAGRLRRETLALIHSALRIENAGKSQEAHANRAAAT
jgi:hypothetical protein